MSDGETCRARVEWLALVDDFRASSRAPVCIMRDRVLDLEKLMF